MVKFSLKSGRCRSQALSCAALEVNTKDDDKLVPKGSVQLKMSHVRLLARSLLKKRANSLQLDLQETLKAVF